MISEQTYYLLWKRHFQAVTKQEMPSYREYLLREEFFKTYLKATKESKIKYILVAEAPPFWDTARLKTGAYVYNFDNLNGLNSPYFKAPCDAFDVSRNPLTAENAQNALNALAQQGVLILDLFPFALKIGSPLRKKIAGNGILKHFWDGDDYSIKTQILNLCNNRGIRLHPKWDLCLIAPPLISCHLVGAYDPLHLSPLPNGLHNMEFKAILPNNLRGCDHKKVASDTSGNPNATLIKVAFDL